MSFAGLLRAAILATGLLTVDAGRAAAPHGRYTVGSGSVYDNETRLTWQRTAPSSTYIQTGAASYCATLNLNGATWRLPTIKELVTIVDVTVASPGPTIDSAAFPGTVPGPFWSSTPYAGASSGVVWAVYFYGGNAYSDDVSNADYVRCVR